MTHDLLIKIMELSRRVLSSGSGIRNAKSIAKAIVNKYDCFCVHFCIFNGSISPQLNYKLEIQNNDQTIKLCYQKRRDICVYILKNVYYKAEHSKKVFGGQIICRRFSVTQSLADSL